MDFSPEGLIHAPAFEQKIDIVARALDIASELCLVEDPPEEPYRSKYKAREALLKAKQSLLISQVDTATAAAAAAAGDDAAPTAPANNSSTTSNIHSSMALIDYRLGLIALAVEENSAGQEALDACANAFFKGVVGDVLEAAGLEDDEDDSNNSNKTPEERKPPMPKEALPGMATPRPLAWEHPAEAADALMQLGLLWSGRGYPRRSILYLLASVGFLRQASLKATPPPSSLQNSSSSSSSCGGGSGSSSAGKGKGENKSDSMNKSSSNNNSSNNSSSSSSRSNKRNTDRNSDSMDSSSNNKDDKNNNNDNNNSNINNNSNSNDDISDSNNSCSSNAHPANLEEAAAEGGGQTKSSPRETVKREERRAKLESLLTHAFYFLAQAYGARDVEQTAKYCAMTLQRQLDAADRGEGRTVSFDPGEWSRNACFLADYYADLNRFPAAGRCLLAAQAVLAGRTGRHPPPTQTKTDSASFSVSSDPSSSTATTAPAAAADGDTKEESESQSPELKSTSETVHQIRTGNDNKSEHKNENKNENRKEIGIRNEKEIEKKNESGDEQQQQQHEKEEKQSPDTTDGEKTHLAAPTVSNDSSTSNIMEEAGEIIHPGTENYPSPPLPTPPPPPPPPSSKPSVTAASTTSRRPVGNDNADGKGDDEKNDTKGTDATPDDGEEERGEREEGEKRREQRADVDRHLAKLYIAVLQTKHLEMLHGGGGGGGGGSDGDSGDSGDSGDGGGGDGGGAFLPGQGEDTRMENLRFGFGLGFGRSLGLGELPHCDPSKVRADFGSVCEVFKRAKTHTERALRHYLLDGFVTAHVALHQGMSRAYLYLSGFEEATKRKQVMCARRAQALEPLLDVLGVKAYARLHKELSFELGEIYQDLADIKVLRVREKFSARTGGVIGGAVSGAGTVATPADVRATNKLMQSAIGFFSHFVAMYHVGDPKLGAADSPSQPAKGLEGVEVAGYLQARFMRARLNGKLQLPTSNQTLHALRLSCADFAWLAEHSRGHLKAAREDDPGLFEQELELAEEMAHLQRRNISNLERKQQRR